MSVIVGQRLFALRPRPEVAHGRFLYYWFTSDDAQNQLRGRATGTTVEGIRQSQLVQLMVSVPPVAEQRAIAQVLGALDDKIESNRRLAEVLDSLVAATYELAVAGCALAPMATAVFVSMGSAFSGSRFSKPGIGRPLLRIRDLKTFDSQTWTTESRRDETVIEPGDVVAGMDAEFRATLWLGGSSLLNQRVCRFRPHPGVSRTFTLHSARRDLASAEASKTGTTVIHLNKADIDRFTVPALDYETHGRLARSADRLLDAQVAAFQESRSLAALRDTLLPELLSGRLRVPEAREQVEAVV